MLIPQHIILGQPLDQLFNKTWDSQKDDSQWGIELPDAHQPGSGNLVISGRSGAGKSTLGMQITYACTQPENNLISVYISLEESIHCVKKKFKAFGWADRLKEVQFLHPLDESSSSEDLEKSLLQILTQPEKCILQDTEDNNIIDCPTDCPGKNQQQLPDTINPCVLLLCLSPRPLSPTAAGVSLFQERFHQLERLLTAARMINKKQGEDKPQIRLVCIDSLNMFGTSLLNREEMYRLFSLFQLNQIVGVFVVEASQDTPFDSTLADVVITLSADEDQGYFLQYLEIVKSRYVPQIFGKHPFKLVSSDKKPMLPA